MYKTYSGLWFLIRQNINDKIKYFVACGWRQICVTLKCLIKIYQFAFYQ